MYIMFSILCLLFVFFTAKSRVSFHSDPPYNQPAVHNLPKVSSDEEYLAILLATARSAAAPGVKPTPPE